MKGSTRSVQKPHGRGTQANIHKMLKEMKRGWYSSKKKKYLNGEINTSKNIRRRPTIQNKIEKAEILKSEEISVVGKT